MRSSIGIGWVGLALVAVLGMVGAGCGDDTSASTTGSGGAASTTATGGGGAGGDGGGTVGLPLLGGDCDPLVPTFCGLPFPSNVYLVDDPTGKNPSGMSVRFGATTLPAEKATGKHIDPTALYDHDGFSPASSPMTHLPMAVADGCATPYDIETSLLADSPTVLIEADTGVRVPHFVDLDMSTDHDGKEGRPDERMVMLRPAQRLKDGTRYIVAIRHVLNDVGDEVTPSPVFSALRSGGDVQGGTAQDAFTVSARRDLYADIFSRLEAAGVGRTDLQIAWDFTTATRENVTGPMLAVRDRALAVVGAEGPTYEVLNVEEFPTPADHPELLRRFELRMTVPSYLTSSATSFDKTEPVARLNRDADGVIQQNGTMTMDVLVLVPRSVELGEKHGLVQNGHGLFGDRHEGQNGYLARFANRNHYVAFSTNFFGFDGDAEGVASQILVGRSDGLVPFTERQVQGMVNQLMAMRMMLGRVATDGVVDGQGNVLVDPQWIDASLRAYRGDSQGGIMGGTYMAVSTDVTRGLLGEPGSPYMLLLNRSVDWFQYEGLMKLGYGDDAVAIQLILATLQLAWDRTEPAGFAPFIEKEQLPGTPQHHVLLHAAIGDHQVSNFAAHFMARSIGVQQLQSDDAMNPVHKEIFGLDDVAAPVTDASAFVEFGFGLPLEPATNVPQDQGCDPHDRVRVLEPAYDQQDVFFRSGVIDWTCNGLCNCDDTLADANEELGCRFSYDQECL
jgi:hypothetical protein